MPKIAIYKFLTFFIPVNDNLFFKYKIPADKADGVRYSQIDPINGDKSQ